MLVTSFAGNAMAPLNIEKAPSCLLGHWVFLSTVDTRSGWEKTVRTQVVRKFPNHNHVLGNERPFCPSPQDRSPSLTVALATAYVFYTTG